jgi:hypothetical protein
MARYPARLHCQTTADVASRLALTADVRGITQSDVATAVLAQHLPTRAELADQIANGDNDDAQQ